MATYQTLAKGVLAAALILGQAGCSTVQSAFNYIKKPFVAEETAPNETPQKEREAPPNQAIDRISEECPHYLRNFRELPRGTKLHVNTTLPHYFVRKSLGEGERDLVDLARNGKIEESFAYDKERGLWIEIGTGEKPERVGFNVNILNEVLSSFYFAHTHIQSVRSPAPWEKLSEREKERLVNDAIPSSKDCETHYRVGIEKWLVATPSGIVDCPNLNNDYYKFYKNGEGGTRRTVEEVQQRKGSDAERIISLYETADVDSLIREAAKKCGSRDEAVRFVLHGMTETFKDSIMFELREPKGFEKIAER